MESRKSGDQAERLAFSIESRSQGEGGLSGLRALFNRKHIAVEKKGKTGKISIRSF